MLKEFFKKHKYISLTDYQYKKDVVPNSHKIGNQHIKDENEPYIPDGLWIKCKKCGAIIYKEDVDKSLYTCTKCNYHIRIDAYTRINTIIDEHTFKEWDKDLRSDNVLQFPEYDKKIEKLQKKTDLKEAVVTGIGQIYGEKTVIVVMDSRFLMGSMGCVVGEKITKAIEKATKLRLPIIIFAASGGARMQEGILSLMQMAKTSAALAKHNEAGLLYISVLTDPTTGGVTASFAMLGDIILAEPGALIGLTGPRVIKQTIGQDLPKGFQTSEFLLNHGFIDKIVPREQLKGTLHQLLLMHKGDLNDKATNNY